MEEQPKFICECEMVFKSNSPLKHHPKTKIHALRMKHFDKKDNLSCDNCNNIFKTIQTYDFHVTNKRCTEPLTCKCGTKVMKVDLYKHYGEQIHKDYIQKTFYWYAY